MKKLFEQTQINKMTLKNRFFRSGLWLNLADEEGRPTEKLIEVYENLAKGGVSTITTGFASVIEWERAAPAQLCAYSEKFIDSYIPFTQRIHNHGANLILQLAFGGSQAAKKGAVDPAKIWGASAIEHRRTSFTPKEMSKEDIKLIQDGFAMGALVAKKSGFDGVQLHNAHGYLLSQMLSPYYNRRSDEYGGSVKNRARFVLETVQKMREKVGDDFNILIKINSEDFEDNGFSRDDSLEVCKMLDNVGINAIEISGSVGMNDAGLEVFRKNILKGTEGQSYFRDHAANVAKEVNCPVMLVGGNRTPELMEEILNNTEISYFSLARTLVSEPDLVNKWADKFDYRPRCVACNRCWSRTGTECIIDRKQRLKDKKKVPSQVS